jgi:MOB kinase activator 1
VNFKKPVKISAPEYVDYLMTWVQNQLDDESIFPSKIGVPFPAKFQGIVKNIFKRLFRVYAHIYHSHFPKIVSLGEEAHLNTSFKVSHFIILFFFLFFSASKISSIFCFCFLFLTALHFLRARI